MISFLLIMGIVGGIENGAPMSNIIWAFLILAIDMVAIYRMEGKQYGNQNQHRKRSFPRSRRV